MARGRKRKLVKREPNGRAQRSSRVEPTPEMAKRKARYNYDWTDPVAGLQNEGHLSPKQASAVSLYRSLVRSCLQGAGPSQNVTGAIKDRVGGSALVEYDEGLDLKRQRSRKIGLRALSDAGSRVDLAIHTLIQTHGYHRYEAVEIAKIRKGADALARVYQGC